MPNRVRNRQPVTFQETTRIVPISWELFFYPPIENLENFVQKLVDICRFVDTAKQTTETQRNKPKQMGSCFVDICRYCR